MTLYVGLDPGASGGLVALKETGELRHYYPFTGNWKVIGDLLQSCKAEGCFAALEEVSAMPGQGVSSMFTFGKNVGGLESLLEYLEVPYLTVRPAKWQKAILGTVPKGEAKERAAAYVRKRFPELQVGLKTPGFTKKAKEGVIDATLIALYCKDYR